MSLPGYRLRRAVLAAGLVGCLAAACPAQGSGKNTWLVGNEHGVWLVRVSHGRFDVLVKPTGKEWKWVQRNVNGGPCGGVALGQQLHVLLSDPISTLLFHHDPPNLRPGLGLKPRHPHWPGGIVPRAVCGAKAFADSKAATLVAVVGSNAAREATRPATGPASRAASGPTSRPTSRRAPSRPATTSAPAGGETGLRNLALFQTVEGQWRFLALREDVHLGDDDRVLVTIAGGKLYVLVHRVGKKADNELVLWRRGEEPPADWQAIPMPKTPAAGRPLGLLTCHDRPCLLYATPAHADAGDEKSRWAVHIASYQGGQAAGGFTDQPVTDADTGKPATWRQADLPIVTSMGEQFALFWEVDGKPKFAPCPLSGQITPTDVGIFDRPPPDDRGGAILDNFTWGLVAAIFFSLFVLRRRGPVKPFALPPQLRPARLHRRLLAATIDAVPFLFLFSVISFVLSGARSVVELEQMIKPINSVKADNGVPTYLAYAGIATAVAYLVYGCAMERRFGATLGKILVGLRVVGNEGSRPSARGIILRNLLKMLELRWLLLLLWPLLNRFRLRLGDVLARTIVVELNPHAPPPGQDETPQADDEDRHSPPGPTS